MVYNGEQLAARHSPWVRHQRRVPRRASPPSPISYPCVFDADALESGCPVPPIQRKRRGDHPRVFRFLYPRRGGILGRPCPCLPPYDLNWTAVVPLRLLVLESDLLTTYPKANTISSELPLAVLFSRTTLNFLCPAPRPEYFGIPE